MSVIKRGAALASVLVLLITGLAIGCGEEEVTQAQDVTFEQLFASPDKYNGSNITVEGFYFHGFEIIVLSERLEYSGLVEGHLVPEGRMLWAEGGIPREIYDSLYKQQMMGPTERYGKVRVTGLFEYGGEYGHLGTYIYQIVPSEVELITWSPQ